MAILRVHTAFACETGGIQKVFRPGDLVDALDPIATPSRTALYLEPIEEAAGRAGQLVEQATAAPGERRVIPTRKKASHAEG